MFNIIELDTGTKGNSCGRGVEQLAARGWRFRRIESKVAMMRIEEVVSKDNFVYNIIDYLRQQKEKYPRLLSPNNGLIL